MTYLDTLFSLKDKVAIITGASRGNGQAIAQGFAEAGATVYNIDIIKGNNLDIKFLHCDITDDQELYNNINHIFEEEGHIDILVNNAGITRSSYSDQGWDDTYAVNMRAPLVLSRLVLKYMKKAGTGSIINITSLNSELAFPDNPSYVAFKGALKQLTKSIALDFGEHNIRANNLGPGYIKTKMTEKSWHNEKSNEARKNKTALKRWDIPKI